jgi:predicted DsbA family dithiol-disulfide isomerase
MTTPRLPLKIDIVSDVVCPWCVLGYLHLQNALERLDGLFDITLQWHPFELNPDMPANGENLREHMRRKYGADATASRSNRERLQQLGSEAGFHFDYFDEMRVVNTFRAHQLLHWAGERAQQTSLQLALFRAFFSEQKDINELDTLVSIAAGVGLPADEAAAVLDDARYAGSVRENEAYWQERDVMAVPGFFFEGSYPVPGAQSSDTFEHVLRRVYAKKTGVDIR